MLLLPRWLLLLLLLLRCSHPGGRRSCPAARLHQPHGPPPSLPPCPQVNNALAHRLFSGQLQVKMHVQQKGGGSGGAKAKAARTGKRAGGDAAAAAAGGGQASGRAARQALPQQQAQPQQSQQWHNPDDPIDLCDDDDEGEDGSNALRSSLVMEALTKLNAYLREHRSNRRAPFQTAALSKVGTRGVRVGAVGAWPAAGSGQGGPRLRVPSG